MFPVKAYALVIVETFMNQSCAPTTVLYDMEFEQIWKDHPEALFLTCYDNFLNEAYKGQTKDFLEPCARRKFSYTSSNDLGAEAKPLIMINGHYTSNYHYPAVTKSGILMADALDELQNIALSREGDDLKIDFPALALNHSADFDVLLYIYAPEILEDEENTMRIINPVYLMDSLEPWDGGTKTLKVSLNDDVRGLSAVVIAQDKNFGPIRAAGHLHDL